MHLTRLHVENVRILRRVDLEPDPGLNVLFGPNGSGKTSLLEAVHLLGTGRSFRAARVEELIRRGEGGMTVSAGLSGDGREGVPIGIEFAGGRARMRYAGVEVRSASRLARALPLVLMTPDTQRLLTDGASFRRRLVDWLLFHVEPTYHTVLVGYRRALRQRNEALRTGAGPRELAGWDEELATRGEALDALRGRWLDLAARDLESALLELVGVPVGARYRRGWAAGEGLGEALAGHRETDRTRGYTGVGPHRADLALDVEGTPAHRVVSRGEGKLVSLALVLGLARAVHRETGRAGVVLMDEVASELDPDSRGRVLHALTDLEAQVFITTVSRELAPAPESRTLRRFHVEQGTVRQVV